MKRRGFLTSIAALMRPQFKEAKAAQAAAFLLKRAGGSMKYIKLLKLMYLADRKALLTKGMPITGDSFVSMEHGMVLSATLNLMRGIKRVVNGLDGTWNTLIARQWFKRSRLLKANPALEKLSTDEVCILDEIFQEFGHRDEWDLVNNVIHNLPEWKDPGESAFPVSVEDILRAEKWSDQDISDVLQDLDEEAHHEAFFADVARGLVKRPI